MARSKRSTGPTAAAAARKKDTAQQSKLSFRAAKGHEQELIEKKEKNLDSVEAAEPPVKKVRVEDDDDDDEAVQVEVEDEPPAAAQAEEEEEASDPEPEPEYFARARALPHAQIKRYWAAKEAGRLAPRVHQQGMSLEDKVLREFDVTSRYGPSIGIERTKRWERAWALGLEPPVEVLAVLVGSGGKVGEVSVVDEVLRGRGGGGGDV